jgi:hypothetical protein
MVLWVWSFVGSGETDYLLFIVSGFIGVVVALQLILMRVRRADETADDKQKLARSHSTTGREDSSRSSAAGCAPGRQRY